MLAEAIRAGKNVLVDKPLCLNADEGEAMLDAHQEHISQVHLHSLCTAVKEFCAPTTDTPISTRIRFLFQAKSLFAFCTELYSKQS